MTLADASDGTPTDLTVCVQKEALSLKDAATLHDRLFENHPTTSGLEEARTVLREKAEAEDGEISHLIFGEVPLLSLAKILDACDEFAGPQGLRGGVFVDLGSGTCRVVAGASLLRPFSEVRGIEILPALHAKATAVVRQLSESRPAPSGEAAAAGEGCASVPQRIAVSCGDFLERDWSDADVAFANSTCFPPKLMSALEERARRLRPGALVVTLTRQLQDEGAFELVAAGRRNMSWGQAGYFVYRRR